MVALHLTKRVFLNVSFWWGPKNGEAQNRYAQITGLSLNGTRFSGVCPID